MVDREATRTLTLAPGSEARLQKLPRVGDVVAEKYRVDSILGQGGMGIVVAVTHLQLQELYAMKFLLPEAAHNAEALERFMREARSAVRIKSEHVARVSDVGQLKNGVPYIVMEHLTGEDLGDRLRDRGPCAIEEAVEYVLQACVGVAEAHARDIVHRDLKPSNLFLTKRLDGAPLIKVLDFGISKAKSDGVDNAEITTSHAVFGSPAYMSPEQLRSAKNADVRSDVWSLGVILYKLLAGEAPFEADTYAGVISAVLGDPPRNLRRLRPEVDQRLEKVILKCLEKDPANRYQRVADLAVALEEFGPKNSHASIGRIVRLGSVSEPAMAPVHEAGRERRASQSPTHQPWVASPTGTGTATMRRKRPKLVALFIGGVAVSLCAVVAFTLPGVLRPKHATPASAIPAPPPSPPAQETVERAALPAPTTAPVEVAPAPPTSSLPIMSAKPTPPVAKTPSSPGRVRPTLPTPTKAATSSSAGVTKIDPTAESH